MATPTEVTVTGDLTKTRDMSSETKTKTSGFWFWKKEENFREDLDKIKVVMEYHEDWKGVKPEEGSEKAKLMSDLISTKLIEATFNTDSLKFPEEQPQNINDITRAAGAAEKVADIGKSIYWMVQPWGFTAEWA